MSTNSTWLNIKDTLLSSTYLTSYRIQKVGNFLKTFSSSSFCNTITLFSFPLHPWLLLSIFFWLLPQQTSKKEVLLGAQSCIIRFSLWVVASIPIASNTINRLLTSSYSPSLDLFSCSSVTMQLSPRLVKRNMHKTGLLNLRHRHPCNLVRSCSFLPQ